MKALFAAIALALCVGIGSPAPAAAQDWLGSHLQAQRHDNLRRHQQRIREQRQARSGRGLSAHQKACARRYRSYNPRTDRYTVRPGVTARCRL
ncbi:BA14K family protein [Sphingosinicella sp. LHD-64]|uniref:BA14K family protein n=1 Tax=Sphingosinicella sp. LHD-64 TaxID=3072139 RepID=UPI00280D8F93|nr:BA14K family protein [Sphingosinicella sp. LHD-64]MDQ8758144.1 BA14K family protein [Sphingosinicella sp. LHD-64]